VRAHTESALQVLNQKVQRISQLHDKLSALSKRKHQALQTMKCFLSSLIWIRLPDTDRIQFAVLQIGDFFHPGTEFFSSRIRISVADPDPGPGAFLTTGSGIRNGCFRIPDLKPIFLKA
jgi:hypothetical protein